MLHTAHTKTIVTTIICSTIKFAVIVYINNWKIHNGYFAKPKTKPSA